MESSVILSKYTKNDTPPTANVNQLEGVLITGTLNFVMKWVSYANFCNEIKKQPISSQVSIN